MEQIGIALFGLTAIFLSQDSRPAVSRWACVFGVIGQPFWFWAAIAGEQWGILLLCFFYSAAWLRGVWGFWVKPWLEIRRG